jgi:hypothetical protein
MFFCVFEYKRLLHAKKNQTLGDKCLNIVALWLLNNMKSKCKKYVIFQSKNQL